MVFPLAYDYLHMDMISRLLVDGVAFVRNVTGIISRPYETQRRIAREGRMGEIMCVALLCSLYFALASAVRTAAFRPFILTRHFVVLSGGAASLYIVAVVLVWYSGRILGGVGTMKTIAVSWAYTLVPTVAWFFMTSLLYVILPPPRTASAWGILFSFVFLVVSAMLFWWKITLVYLTVRFGMKLDMARILVVLGVTAPVVGIYSYYLYRWGVFKIPFV